MVIESSLPAACNEGGRRLDAASVRPPPSDYTVGRRSTIGRIVRTSVAIGWPVGVPLEELLEDRRVELDRLLLRRRAGLSRGGTRFRGDVAGRCRRIRPARCVPPVSARRGRTAPRRSGPRRRRLAARLRPAADVPTVGRAPPSGNGSGNSSGLPWAGSSGTIPWPSTYR